MLKDVEKEIRASIPLLEDPCMQEVATDCIIEFFEYCELELVDYVENKTYTARDIAQYIAINPSVWEEYMDSALAERKSQTNVAIFATSIDWALYIGAHEDRPAYQLAATGFAIKIGDEAWQTAFNILNKYKSQKS